MSASPIAVLVVVALVLFLLGAVAVALPTLFVLFVGVLMALAGVAAQLGQRFAEGFRRARHRRAPGRTRR